MSFLSLSLCVINELEMGNGNWDLVLMEDILIRDNKQLGLQLQW